MDFLSLRQNMVDTQIRARGITHPLVLSAMLQVAREKFVRIEQQNVAYLDRPLPIGFGQTISQPYIVAKMLDLIAPLFDPNTSIVLEVGTGCGYAAACLSFLVQHVYSIERIEFFYQQAIKNIKRHNIKNISLKLGDGTMGWVGHAPYHAIIVTAASETIPESLKTQLKIGGQLVIPVGKAEEPQALSVVTKLADNHYSLTENELVRFVPLISDSKKIVKS